MSNLIPNIDKYKLEKSKLSNDDDKCVTFVLHHEDHTLGNTLRYMIMKDPAVEFCGYTVPHPSEHQINLRIQTRGKPCHEVLQTALYELQNTCDHVLDTFKDAFKKFKNAKPQDDSDEEDMEEEDDDDA